MPKDSHAREKRKLRILNENNGKAPISYLKHSFFSKRIKSDFVMNSLRAQNNWVKVTQYLRGCGSEKNRTSVFLKKLPQTIYQ